MSWQGIEGHDEVVDLFRRALARRRLATTYLFVGPPGIGKRSFAVALAQTLLCRDRDEALCDPCGRCPDCLRVLSGQHPDLDLVGKPKDKSVIPLETFIGSDERRMQEGLCYRLSLAPYMGRRKVAIIDDADALNVEGANALLKTLEEPPPQSVLILISSGVEKQLPTIRSRCQIVLFSPLSAEIVARLLTSRGLVEDPVEARRLAALCGGSLSEALDRADPALEAFRARLAAALLALDREAVAATRELVAFVEDAGREAPPRRERMRRVLREAVDFFRGKLLAACGASPEAAAGSPATLESAVGGSPWRDLDRVGQALDRTFEAQQHLERNVHLTTLVEWWFDELSQIASSAVQTAPR